MSNPIDISFVVPVYGSEDFLSRCLDSILAQKGISFEILVVNDGSPGPCDQVIQPYLDKYEKIKYIKHAQNRSLMQARLTGLESAAGEYVIHVDSDDWIANSTGKSAIKVAKKFKADIVQFGMHYGSDAESMVPHFSNRTYFLRGDEILEKFLAGELWWTQAGKLFKRDIMSKALANYPVDRALHVNSLEDLALTFPAVLSSTVYVANPDAGSYFYYHNPSSMTKRVVASEKKWNKLCHDMGAVRKIVLEQSRRHQSVDVPKLEKLLYRNYEWSFKMIHELPKSQRRIFLRTLNEAFSVEAVINNLPIKYFPDFAADFSLSDGEVLKAAKVKKICFVSEVLHSGGAERATLLLAKMLLDQGFEVCAITDEPYSSKEYWRDSRFERYHVPKARVERWKRLPEVIEEKKIDLCIHISHYRNEMMFDLLRLSDKCWNVAVEHSMFFFPFYKPDMNLFLSRRAAYNYADALVCLSEANRQWWVASGVENSVVIHNPLTFSTENAILSKGRSKDILFVGRLCEMKGAMEALQTFREVLTKHPDARLIMLGRYGSKDDQDLIQSFIRESQMDSNVIIKGHVDNVSDYFEGSRIQIMTSLVEGAPMVLNEAKSHGVPSVLLGLSFLENVGEENGAVVVEKGDLHKMAEVICDILGDDQRWATLSQSALQSVLRIDETEIVKQWQNLIANLPSKKAISNDVSPFLKMTMTEFLDGMEYGVFQLSPNTVSEYVPPYLRSIEQVVDKYLPPGTPRRKNFVKLCRKSFHYLLEMRRVIKRLRMRV